MTDDKIIERVARAISDEISAQAFPKGYYVRIDSLSQAAIDSFVDLTAVARRAIDAMHEPDADDGDFVEVRVAVAVSSYVQDGERIYETGSCSYVAGDELDDEWAIDEARACLGRDRPKYEAVLVSRVPAVQPVPEITATVERVE